jgi:hypothetical protein
MVRSPRSSNSEVKDEHGLNAYKFRVPSHFHSVKSDCAGNGCYKRLGDHSEHALAWFVSVPIALTLLLILPPLAVFAVLRSIV